jgi:hypothetical protein
MIVRVAVTSVAAAQLNDLGDRVTPFGVGLVAAISLEGQ